MPAGIFNSLLFAFSGLLLFIQIYNRSILTIKNGPFRTLLTALVFGAMVIVSGVYGLFFHSNRIVILASAIIFCCLIIEIHQRIRKNVLRVKESIDTRYWNTTYLSGRWFQDTSEQLVIRRFFHSPHAWTSEAFRIAHISDLHVDKHTTDRFLETVFEALASVKPDMLLVTGDFSDAIDQLERLAPLFKGLSPAQGIFGVLGNHDFWLSDQATRKVLESSGMQFPSFKGMTLNITPSQRLTLHGIDYPYVKPWLLNSVKHDSALVNIALSHTPDVVFKLARAGMDMVFSGHLHGGQWRFPGVGSVISPSIYDRLLDHGHYKIRQTHLFVTSGVGRAWISKRINCPAEILVVDVLGSSDRSLT